jgi:DNA helicase HerA-like ATPase
VQNVQCTAFMPPTCTSTGMPSSATAKLVHLAKNVGYPDSGERRLASLSRRGEAHLSARELAGHGAAFGGPGSGKTTFLQLLVEASADQVPVVAVDPKGSPALAKTVRPHGGQV